MSMFSVACMYLILGWPLGIGIPSKGLSPGEDSLTACGLYLG